MIIFITNIMLAVSLSVDALGIGVAYGLKGVKIPITAKIIIFAASFVIATLCELLGQYLLSILLPFVIKAIGIVILLAVGVYTVFSDPFSYDADKSLDIDLSEAFFMGIALSIDSVGVVIGNTAIGGALNILPLAISICQFGFLSIGQKIGSKIMLRGKLGYRSLSVLTGAIIIIIAVFRIMGS
ncbi:MAG: hypothetical protein M0R40_02165 [Firmicutes bacterium]|nr:hypothetical protein [Bacillota bacterium]